MSDEYVTVPVPKGAMPKVIAAIDEYLNGDNLEASENPSRARPATGPRGAGWTPQAIDRMVEESSPAAKAILELLASRPDEWLRSADQAEALRTRQSAFGGIDNKDANWNTVAGTVGALARRVASRYKLELPIEFREDSQGRWLRRMSPELATLVSDSLRKSSNGAYDR